MSSVNILLIHGSSHPAHAQAAGVLAENVAQKAGREFRIVRLGEELPTEALVMPLFLSEGKHLQEDVSAMLEASNGRPVPGPASFPDEMAEMIAGRVAEKRGRCRAAMFVLYRLLGATALSAALYRSSKQFPLPAVAALHGECRFTDTLALWKQEGQGNAFLQPVLLFPGASHDSLKQQAADSGLEVNIGEPLAMLPEFADWVAGRFLEAA